MPPADAPTPFDENPDLEGLLLVRWGLFVGGAALVAVGALGSTPGIPVIPALIVVSLGLLSNAALSLALPAGEAGRRRAAGTLLTLDTVLMTALFALSGGTASPFTAAYLVPVVLGALLLDVRGAWAVCLLALGGYGLLFLAPPGHAHHAGMGGHALGMAVAFGLVGPFLTFSICRMRRALRAADDRARAAEVARARAERLASLATLATGAAHELSTPLGTIAVAAADLEQRLAPAGGPAHADAALIRAQVARARDILGQLAAHAGVDLWDAAVPTTPGDLLGLALEGVAGAADVGVEGEDALLDTVLRLPERVLARALRGLLRNARQAAGAGGAVSVGVARDGAALVFTVADDGPGMAPAVRARAGEPFFTTRPPGEGMGLGLFHARSVAEQLGGGLDIESGAGGTRVRLHLPLPPGEEAT